MGTAIKKCKLEGAWVTKTVEHPTLGFGSAHDVSVMGLSPASGPTLNRVSA